MVFFHRSGIPSGLYLLGCARKVVMLKRLLGWLQHGVCCNESTDFPNFSLIAFLICHLEKIANLLGQVVVGFSEHQCGITLQNV